MESINKVSAQHLQRMAYLYIRQSTLRQMVENVESTKRQYALRQRAIALGWSDEQVHVIDCDLGESGASTTRDGFKSLVSEVSLGRVGIVMGLEVSRLARNSSDWHRLLEICAFSSTLILDEEGIYNPAHFNDRLLLGLKGTMSEAELHIIRARLFGGMLNKAKRGELYLRPPVGYVYDNHNKMMKDPDKRVQEAVGLFFETFRRVGSAGGIVSTFRKQGLTFPRRLFSGPQKGEVLFAHLTRSRANQILHNPRYTGAYAYGLRQQFRKGLEQQVHTKFVAQDQWKALIKDRHYGYISWAEYDGNLAKLAENSTDIAGHRRCPPREGPALLQGLGICGLCGRKFTVRYHSRRNKVASPDYVCIPDVRDTRCQHIPGEGIDALIGKILVERMQASTIETALSVQNELISQFEATDRIRYQHVENAKYEMESAKRRYMAIDPNNRLVADELESDWNQKIQAYRESCEEYERRKSEDRACITEEQRKRVLELAHNFSALWHSKATEDKDRKRMVRLLISDVTLTKGDSDIKIQIRFVGGATEEHNIPRPRSACEEMKHHPEVIAEIDRLLNDYTDGEVAEILNQNKFQSGTGKQFDAKRVQVIRRAYGLTNRENPLRKEGRYTMAELCKKFGTNRWKVYELRNDGQLKAYRYDDVGRYLYEPLDDTIFHTKLIRGVV